MDFRKGHARARRIAPDDHRLLGPRRLVRRAQFAARVLRPAALSSVTETYLSHISVIVLPCNNICICFLFWCGVAATAWGLAPSSGRSRQWRGVEPAEPTPPSGHISVATAPWERSRGDGVRIALSSPGCEPVTRRRNRCQAVVLHIRLAWGRGREGGARVTRPRRSSREAGARGGIIST